MQNPLNVLILENEALLVDVLKNALTCLKKTNYFFNIKTADSCNSALKEIKKHTTVDLALINVNVPPCNNSKLLFAEDISIKLKLAFPNIKIILFSTYKNNTQIYSLIQTINPECLLVKSDIDYTELINAIETVIIEPPYYSKSVLRHIRKRIAHNIIIDIKDKAILHYLSIGTKMKDLPNLVHLSKSAVELRKRKLKESFGLDKGNDGDLLERAREKGFV